MKKLNFFALLLSSLLFSNCEQQEQITPDPLADIKSAFENYSGTTFGLPERFDIQWEQMKESQQGHLYFPAIPIFKVNADDSLDVYDGLIQYELIAQRTEKQLEVWIAKLRPQSNQKNGFTGSKLLYTLESNLEIEYHYEQGWITRETPVDHKPQSGGRTPNQIGREEGCSTQTVRVDHYTDWYSVAYSSSDPSDISVQFMNTEFTGSTFEFRTICSEDSPISNPSGGDDNTLCRCGGSTGPTLIKETTDLYICPGGQVRDGPGIDGCISEEELWEAQIDDTQLQPCMQVIMTNLKNLTKGVGQIVTTFAGNTPRYNWKTQHGTLSNNQNAFTSQQYNSSTGTVTTTFDTNKFGNASDLSVARTMLHESVHAYLVAFFKNDPLAASKSYSQLLQDYYQTQDANFAHHQEMARNFVNNLALALQEFGSNNGYNNPLQFYTDLAWGGLEGTTYFANLSQTDKNRIGNIILIELTGKDSNGNTKPQKGNNAGC